MSATCISDIALRVAIAPVFSAVYAGSGFPVGHGAGLHIPPEHPSVRPGQLGHL